jgi:dolichol-phosphate mannosyltransferase
MTIQTDGTREYITKIKAVHKYILLINRKKKFGVGSAHKLGIKYGYKKRYKHIITMDCDGTHDPIYLKKILELSKNSDLVITNRFQGKNSLKGWSFLQEICHYISIFIR